VVAALAVFSILITRHATAADNEKTWYVNAARPDDSGDGHSPASAKKTMTAALSASAEGDTFYIAPGVYSSTASLSPKNGQTWIGSGWSTILQKTTGGFSFATVILSNRSGITIENIRIQNTAAGGQGLYSLSCNACMLRRVWADGALDGARLDGFDTGFIDQCKATSNYDAWVINGRCTTVQNTVGITSGTAIGTNNPMTCFKISLGGSPTQDVQVNYVNCQAYSLRTASNTQPTAGWEADAHGQVLIENSGALIVATATNEASQLLGVSVIGNGLCVLSGNCFIRAENASAAGALDLNQAESGSLQVDSSTSQYLTTSGTTISRLPNITPGASGGLTLEP
jgi:hypothetical protein